MMISPLFFTEFPLKTFNKNEYIYIKYSITVPSLSPI
jgi:hypothetical protein